MGSVGRLADVAGMTGWGGYVDVGLPVAASVSVGEGCGVAVMVGEGIMVSVGCGVTEGVTLGVIVMVIVGVLVGVGCPPMNQNPMAETEHIQQRTIKTAAAAMILLRPLSPWIRDHSPLNQFTGSSSYSYS